MMQVKRYQASSMQEAISIVKNDLGDDAVILKTQSIQRSGTFDLLKEGGVEVIAAMDVSTTDWVEFSRMDKSAVPAKGDLKIKQRQSVEKGAPVSNIQSWSPTEKITSRKEGKAGTDGEGKIGNNREKMIGRSRGSKSSRKQEGEKDVSAPRQKKTLPEGMRSIVIELLENGVSEQVARKLVNYTRSYQRSDKQDEVSMRKYLGEAIAKMINVSGPIRCRKGKSKVVALVGQTGVGKTTTLAKLATKGKFFFDKNVSLISADTYRMSAIEHLNTFAGIAHLPISAVYSPNELRSVLDAQKGKDLVFIDTAGRSPRDERHIKELKGFMEEARPDEIHLVLPANNKHEDLMEAINRFGLLPINGIVFSKVDETNSLGTILNVAAESPYPISYITNGQTIPDDIELASSQKLASMMIRAA